MAARPATRNRPAPPAEGRPRASVRDFAGRAGYSIEWDVRPVYDFLFALSGDAGSTDDLPATDRAWLTSARASLADDVRASVGRLFENELAIHVASFAVDRPDIRTARQFVAALDAAGQAETLRSVVCDSLHEPGLAEAIDRMAAGDATALPDIERRLPEKGRDERLVLLADPPRTHGDVIAVLTAWADQFEAIEGRIAAMLERDYASRAADRATLPPADLIEKTTGGLRWLGEPGVRRVILAPSYFSRPYNFLLGSAEWRFFGYPLADDALDAVDPLAPPQSVLRLHRALGDETRLRILKLLAGRDLYLTEIAQQLDLSKPTIKHHLSLLRAAGIVTITESGTVMYYSLRRPRLDDASAELKRFLTSTTD
ncbi:MAG TPA: metalloregulator ArsR/SmtB family transcription factor [Candidatus Limnocylindrales bacterium]|nr:metalloregulator ArsR/SmtB family transcription factor [Candidatus Limnocylindrales bacterium]